MSRPYPPDRRLRHVLDHAKNCWAISRRRSGFAVLLCLSVPAVVAAHPPVLVAEHTLPPHMSPAPTATPSAAELEWPALEKLRSLVLKQVTFRETSVQEAVQQLQQKSSELSTSTADAQIRGVNFVLQLGPELRLKPVSLNLQNVSLYEVVRSLCAAAGARLRITPFSVVIYERPTSKVPELYTKVFRVPPDFLNLAFTHSSGDGFPHTATAMEVLKQAGLTFAEGSMASFTRNGLGSFLVIRNTSAELELTERFIETINPRLPMTLRWRSFWTPLSEGPKQTIPNR